MSMAADRPVTGGHAYCPDCGEELHWGGCHQSPQRSTGVLARCGIEGCARPLLDPTAAEREPEFLHRCALHEIALYNAEDLREGGEDNAADMVEFARRQLQVEREAE